MATVARQPFAPLDSARLQSLTSTKNRQNGIPIPTSSPGKRKAGLLDLDDSENLDPVTFSKRSKGANVDGLSKDALKAIQCLSKTPGTAKPTSASSSLSAARTAPLATPKKPLAASRRSIPQPKTPIERAGTRISTSAPKLSAYSVPAGRSPPSMSKRPGSLSTRRRTFGSYTRVDPPSFGPASSSTAAPFSLDAALKGTIAGYAPRTTAPPKKSGLSKAAKLLQPQAKSGWFFDIHEDSPEQEMTNLLQHSTCVLDISSDEETEERASRDTAEGRNKENIPPADHLSQVSTRRADKTAEQDDMVEEKQRIALGEMDAAEFYPEGCDDSSVILLFDDADDDATTIVGDDEGEEQTVADMKTASKPVPVLKVDQAARDKFDDLVSKRNTPVPKVAVLEPIEGTGESFELWESDSSKDESEAPAASP